ncbi:DUF2878 domain-containing protein [Pseudoxanthomonas sp. PXM02]|uniref:DUF2878 domain-containing protein n=1 Tax=Pseudoxanthomonas sp. PXM02 TaxID=2769294 RepID=UPI00178468B0|nr:DUF2878 domain-containing protein [Pseudoxanthomonas sp. PXM02]MBD9480959.1 DUF2878 domain-containing protein [Pseudoxanthomonas sp. PXM02]
MSERHTPVELSAPQRHGVLPILVNVLGNQLVWLVAVIAAGKDMAWPGVLASAVFVGLHLRVARTPLVELKLVVAAIGCGLLVDGVAGSQGWLVYRAAPLGSAIAAPWILALWAALAVTLTVSMHGLQRRLWLAMIVGGIGGPLAYLAAARGWGSVALVNPEWVGLLWLGSAWAVALPGLLWAARYLTATTLRRRKTSSA